ncbi:MAG TPA: ABC transporter substrate-binding protein [Rhizomicrobium sp.]
MVAVVAIILVAVAVFVGRLQRSDDTAFEYHLKWLANAGFVGDLYADSYGDYINEGLKVQVVQGGPDRDAITQLLQPNGSTMFAVASADQVIRAIYKHADLKVIAQIYAANPVRWIYRAKLGMITQPEQLRGKRIGVSVGDNDETIMKTYLAKNHIDGSTAPTLVGIQFDYGPFTTGAVDLFPVYSNTQAVELERQLKAQGEEVRFFDPSIGPTGVRFVANSIVTTSRIIANHRDLVQRFLSATLKGWADATKPENLVRSVHAVQLAAGDGGPKDDVIADEVKATAILVIPSNGDQIGTIDTQGWIATEEAMRSAGQLGVISPGTPTRIQGFLTSEFLPKKN